MSAPENRKSAQKRAKAAQVGEKNNANSSKNKKARIVEINSWLLDLLVSYSDLPYSNSSQKCVVKMLM